jgi:hypothetical protein
MPNDKLQNDKMSNDKLQNDKMSNDKLQNDKMTNDKLQNDKLLNEKLQNAKMSKMTVNDCKCVLPYSTVPHRGSGPDVKIFKNIFGKKLAKKWHFLLKFLLVRCPPQVLGDSHIG